MDLESPVSIIAFFAFVFLTLKFVGKVRKASKLPPGPWKLPVLGHIHHLLGKLPHHALRDLAMKHGPIIHLQLAEISAVVISSPRLAKEVMKTQDLTFADRPKSIAFTILTYNNTDIGFSPYGEYWRQMRKICMLELLSAKKVMAFSSIREDECWNLVESIRSSSGTPVNLSKKFYAMINSMMCRSVFGKRCKEQDALIMLIKRLSTLVGGFSMVDLFPSLKLLHFLAGTKARIVKVHDEFDRILNDIISMHNGWEPNIEEDLVDVLLRLKNSGGLEFPLTSDNIKAVIFDMFSAGTETSTTMIEWAMSEMIRHPRVMEKAQVELRQALKGKGKLVETDIRELSYLKLVIKETLRLHPPLALSLPRECREECEIGGFKVPFGTKVIVNVWAIMRDPEYWEDAESFIPERFENNPVSMVGTEFEYVPFGGGRRMCPGASLGLANVELPLAQLLYHFDWKLPGGTGPEDIDMSEVFGASVTRKNDLVLVPNPYYM